MEEVNPDTLVLIECLRIKSCLRKRKFLFYSSIMITLNEKALIWKMY
jgi:hypothetical protein